MFYRESGDFKTTYAKDTQTFPIKLDRVGYYTILAVALIVIPLLLITDAGGSANYWTNAIFLPFLIWAIASIGLNILVGYCGQLSLGSGGFMAVGAYASYKLMTSFPDLSILIVVILSGAVTAGVGILFGLPSLRIKGFYLAVATLAAQFFLVWLFNKVPWFYNYSASGQITAPTRSIFGFEVTGATATPEAKYLFCLVLLIGVAWVARNLTRGRIGRSWMAIRDMISQPKSSVWNLLRRNLQPLVSARSLSVSQGHCSSRFTLARLKLAKPSASRNHSCCCSWLSSAAWAQSLAVSLGPHSWF